MPVRQCMSSIDHVPSVSDMSKRAQNPPCWPWPVGGWPSITSAAAAKPCARSDGPN